jgi:hypothetical protein
MSATRNTLKRRERQAILHYGPKSPVDTPVRLMAELILRRHPDLVYVRSIDCADEDEHRSVQRLLANAAGIEPDWCPPAPGSPAPGGNHARDAALPTTTEIFAGLARLRQQRLAGEPSPWERIEDNIRGRRNMETAS